MRELISSLKHGFEGTDTFNKKVWVSIPKDERGIGRYIGEIRSIVEPKIDDCRAIFEETIAPLASVGVFLF